MNILLLFSLIDPKLVKSRFKPDEGLMRISRIYKAASIAAARKGMEAPQDTFLDYVSSHVYWGVNECEVTAAGKIVHPLLRKYKRIQKEMESPVFASGCRSRGPAH